MSIFEDLIEELKEENLLEETVIEVHKDKNKIVNQQASAIIATQAQPNTTATAEVFQAVSEASPVSPSVIAPLYESNLIEDPFDDAEIAAPSVSNQLDNDDLDNDDFMFVADDEGETFAEASKHYPVVEKPKAYVNEKEYFRKRAIDEVSGLQMVDHVLSGIEREQKKTVPQPYDDLTVKLALHDFLQDANEANTTEHAQAEFKLMQETENWYSALSVRDNQISIAQLRRYCETTRPALSSQALIALARFYRNSPYTEQVRSKFELVTTRLFSHQDENERRELILERGEIIQQLKELYADWSSIQLYSANESDSEIVVSMMKFEDFVTEAEHTESFDQLISGDFFNRLRLFKEDCRDNFYAPTVAAAAIESNIKIGNRYLSLLDKEKEKFNAATLEERYGFLHDQVISDATSKTYQLVELLQEKNLAGKRDPAEIVEVSVKEGERSAPYRAIEKPKSKIYSVNKWLLAAAILIIGSCVGLYMWAEYQTPEIKPTSSVKKVNLDNSDFKDFIQTARISEDTLFGITTANWESLNGEKKEELLKKLQSIGADKNYKKVHLINENGKSVGFASAEKAEVYNQ